MTPSQEFVLRQYDLSSTQLVGYEGGVGCLLMIGLFQPVRFPRGSAVLRFAVRSV